MTETSKPRKAARHPLLTFCASRMLAPKSDPTSPLTRSGESSIQMTKAPDSEWNGTTVGAIGKTIRVAAAMNQRPARARCLRGIAISHSKGSNAGLQLRRASSIQAEGKKLLEKHT